MATIEISPETSKKYTLKDSYLIKKQDEYYIHFCISIPEPEIFNPKEIVGIYLGLKNPFTLTNLSTKKTTYLGKELKEVRGKYFYFFI